MGWDIRTGSVVKTMPTSEPIMDMEVSYTTSGAGDPFLTVAAGQTVQFWNANTYECVKIIEVGDFGLQAATLHPERGRFVAGGLDMAVRVFSFENGALLEEHRGHHGP